ncbi:MAG: DNA replication/repair protein RecF [Micavibrio sp.]|nr:DNA replication/repair protein RecF [Micavibrio sp.]
MRYIHDLKLYNFRSYSSLLLKDIEAGFNVFFGANGAGKTNILEALSLFSPGKGLRGAKYSEMQNVGAPAPWVVSANLATEYGPIQIGTGLDGQAEKRVVRIQGESAKGQSAMSEHISCVWLTPQMDRLFLDSSSHRRKFLDRLVFTFDPAHSGRVTRYENAMRQRSKVLQQAYRDNRDYDPLWLTGLEKQMAETGVSIAAARTEFVRNLQGVCNSFDNPYFPRASLRAKGTLEELLNSAPALEIEEVFRYQLEESRKVDQVTGGAATGPHKGDLDVYMADKNMPAEHCSTGEQKALLIGIILAHSHLILGEKGFAPLLLFDEVAAHLDDQRRKGLFDLLEDLKTQIWLTGTDENLFSALQGRARFYCVDQSSVR